MTSPERSTAEYASVQQLEAIFKATTLWLALNGDYEATGPIPIAYETDTDGILVSDHTLALTQRFAGEDIRRAAPEAAVALRIGHLLTVSETVPHRKEGADGQRLYQPNRCIFSISRAERDNANATELESLIICGVDAEIPWSTERQVIAMTQLSETLLSEQLEAGHKPKVIEQKNGGHAITQTEARALTEITSHLDAISHQQD